MRIFPAKPISGSGRRSRAEEVKQRRVSRPGAVPGKQIKDGKEYVHGNAKRKHLLDEKNNLRSHPLRNGVHGTGQCDRYSIKEAQAAATTSSKADRQRKREYHPALVLKYAGLIRYRLAHAMTTSLLWRTGKAGTTIDR